MKDKFLLNFGVICILTSTFSFGVDLDGKTVLLESVASGNCMQVEGNNDEEGTKLIQYPCEKSDIQKFTFSKVDDNYYNISLENGKKLSVAGQSKSNGVNIVQSSTGNEFKVIEKDSGFNLQSKHSNKFVSTTSYNSDIVQEGKAVEAKQLWKVYSVIPKSCKDILDSGLSTGDGVYTIAPDRTSEQSILEVYCDMTTDGGGWTLVGNFVTSNYTEENIYSDINSSTDWYYGHKVKLSSGINNVMTKLRNSNRVEKYINLYKSSNSFLDSGNLRTTKHIGSDIAQIGDLGIGESLGYFYLSIGSDLFGVKLGQNCNEGADTIHITHKGFSGQSVPAWILDQSYMIPSFDIRCGGNIRTGTKLQIFTR